MHTTTTKASSKILQDLQGQALEKLQGGTLDWRRHGIGLIQAYLHESTSSPERRLHIWHPSAIRPGILGQMEVWVKGEQIPSRDIATTVIDQLQRRRARA